MEREEARELVHSWRYNDFPGRPSWYAVPVTPEDEARLIELIAARPTPAPGVEALRDFVGRLHRSSFRAGGGLRRHSCSSCGLTDEEQAEVDGYNAACEMAAKVIAGILDGNPPTSADYHRRLKDWSSAAPATPTPAPKPS